MTTRPPRPSRRGRLRLHFVTFELSPLAQSGGLGDAAGALARALAERGHEVTCVVPAHRDVLASPACPPLVPGGPVRTPSPDGPLVGRWLVGELDGLHLQLLDQPALYDRAGLYGGDESAEAMRAVALSRAAAELASVTHPDVLVAHDWHAALAIGALRTGYDFGATRGVGTVQVIHNGAYVGRFPSSVFPLTGLPASLFHPDAVEFWGDLALLKAGLAFADRIVAVSPHYARELTTPEFGEGLDGLYRFRAHRLLGIANGIDVDRYDPATDPALPARFGAHYPKPKGVCRKALVEATGLDDPPPGRLLAAIGRLAGQKGWDVLCDALPALVAGGASLVLIGDGDPALAARLRGAAARWPGRVHAVIGWDERLARRTYAGADAVLVPSRYEPCGLVQRLAQRYGAVPVAHRVGGLVDTIADGRTGVLFAPLDPDALVAAVERAVAWLEADGAETVQRRLLALDVSWAGPAAEWDRLLAAVAREAAKRL